MKANRSASLKTDSNTTPPSLNLSIQSSVEDIHKIHEEVREAGETLAMVMANQKVEWREADVRLVKNSLLLQFLFLFLAASTECSAGSNDHIIVRRGEGVHL
jgi:hypothetical protein